MKEPDQEASTMVVERAGDDPISLHSVTWRAMWNKGQSRRPGTNCFQRSLLKRWQVFQQQLRRP